MAQLSLSLLSNKIDFNLQIDLLSIDSVYKNMFGKRLEKLVREETGGHYRNMLLALLGARI